MKPQTPTATVKAFFARHPSVYIAHHWRADQIQGAAREAMFAPRIGRVRGRAIVFDTSLGRSELALASVKKAEIDGDLLHLSFNGQDTQLTYQALPQ